MNVFLTEPAEQYLRLIYEYYQFDVSVNVAQRIIDRIFTRLSHWKILQNAEGLNPI